MYVIVRNPYSLRGIKIAISEKTAKRLNITDKQEISEDVYEDIRLEMIEEPYTDH